jgi:hypothetical protein
MAQDKPIGRSGPDVQESHVSHTGRVVAGHVGLIALFAVMNYGLFLSQKPTLDLAKRNVRTTGVVTGLQPRNHDRIEYMFVVSGAEYRGHGTGAHITRIGDKVTVYYLPDNPSNNLALDPQQAAGGAIGALAFSLFLSGAFMWGAIRHSRVRLATRSGPSVAT